jgi:hypothetical protein
MHAHTLTTTQRAPCRSVDRYELLLLLLRLVLPEKAIRHHRASVRGRQLPAAGGGTTVGMMPARPQEPAAASAAAVLA